MKVQVIQSKNGIMINVGVSVKNQMIGVVVQMTKFGILVRVIESAIRHVKLTVI